MSADRIDVVVECKESIADDAVRVRLQCASGDPLPAWEPGAHIDVALPGDLLRQFSLCGDPTDLSSYEIAVRREADGRGGSALIHDRLRAGDGVQISVPRNHFALDDAERYVFIAGGIGITPILPMIAVAQAQGREWELAYCGGSQRSMPFAADLADAYGDRVRLYPSDEGRRLDLVELLGRCDDATAVYCCGPTRMLDAAVEHARERAYDGVRVERFTPIEVTESDVEFEVELDTTGEVLPVPAGRSILSVVREAGVEIESSCEEGTCGTCETVVFEGEPEHRDAVLSDLEREFGDTMMICVSRCRGGRLVLDL
ncbi:ferredoxin [Microbacterium faecale]|uniref:Ferredoxin n=1 Tax=Microbacterium faecale TaxID=1804630 RepID=A0A916YFK7_9MICO|nr:PDR/VanB family oxidoreductase [Microbacterium faecale]GGD42938.1 ferredoxin [Microbacterium faecale]